MLELLCDVDHLDDYQIERLQYQELPEAREFDAQ